MKFLLEYKESAGFALELAKREVTHLAYTHHTLFAQTLNLEWVSTEV